MAFTVEDGTGLADANAYVAVAFVDSYQSDRGNSAWTGADGLKQAAIIKASSYVDKRFGRRFRGTRLHASQALCWPRFDAYRDDKTSLTSMPAKLKEAVAEYAIRALLINVLAPDMPQNAAPQSFVSGATTATTVASGRVSELKEVVGPIETTTKFATSATSSSSANGTSLVGAGSLPEYPEADMLLEELLNPLARETVRA